MKTVLAALNSKYIHMSLAPWYLKAAADGRFGEIKIIETTINRSGYDILREIYREKPDILGFSCYIFNIVQIERIVNDIKKLLPELKIVLGGPEVSYDAAEVLRRCPGADYIACGEGEQVFTELLSALCAGSPADGIAGLALRCPDGGIAVNPPERPSGDPPSPYSDEMLREARGKILYFEASRGCPFRCSYCLSSASGGARFFEPCEVKSRLERVMRSGARQVKFVDRTFNCNLPRAKEIIRFILSRAGEAADAGGPRNFHFEAAADLFDDELIGLLAAAPRGLIQLEIGIQSLNAAALEAAERKTDLAVCMRNIGRLLTPGNIHIHLDLIAGLPYEDYGSFARSFNGVFGLFPHTLQLGFLKLLKGSALRGRAEKLGVEYEALPPYEVLRTPWLSFDELGRLKQVEFCCDRLYNSGKFASSVRFAAARFPSPFAFFEAFAAFLSARGGFDRALSLRELYDLFSGFARENLPAEEQAVFAELLKYDCFSSDNTCNPPASLARIANPAARELYLSDKSKGGVRAHFEIFSFDPVLYAGKGLFSPGPVTLRFDYGSRDPVSGLFTSEIVQ